MKKKKIVFTVLFATLAITAAFLSYDNETRWENQLCQRSNSDD